MAVSLHDSVRHLVALQLERRLRYRCLVVQAGDMQVIESLKTASSEAAECLDAPVEILDASDMLDDVGALACNRVIDHVTALALNNAVVIAGPLHCVDYWSTSVCNTFWSFLAGFSHGPGIIVVDSPRTDGIEGTFKLIGALTGLDIRYFKSRLASAKDGLV